MDNPLLPRWMRYALPAMVLSCATAPAQEEQYRERDVLDPETDAWVDAPVQPGTPQGELDEARSLLAQGKSAAALRLLKKWTAANPDHDRYLEGMFLLGESYFEERDFYKAYQSYDVVVQNTGGELFYKALRREMDVARAFLSGQKRILWRIFRIPAYDDCVKIVGRVWEQVPGTRMGEESLKHKADYHFENGDLDLAQDGYVKISREYPNGRYTQAAMLRAAEAAEAAFPGVKHDDRALVDANERYRHVQDAYPDFARRENVDERLESIRQKRAEKDYAVAQWYEKVKQTGAAEFYYKRLLRDYPGTLASTQALGRLRALGVEAATPTTQETPQQ
ncbi:MAG: outer membrane protein assembly factor BamD [Planctomycetes bacterium]|nr:outer membrane protein assembly factor BamD [Planctomycetota bacterium]